MKIKFRIQGRQSELMRKMFGQFYESRSFLPNMKTILSILTYVILFWLCKHMFQNSVKHPNTVLKTSRARWLLNTSYCSSGEVYCFWQLLTNPYYSSFVRSTITEHLREYTHILDLYIFAYIKAYNNLKCVYVFVSALWLLTSQKKSNIFYIFAYAFACGIIRGH